MGRPEFSESYLGHKYWHMDGEDLPITPAKGETQATYDGTITVAVDAGDYDKDNRTNALVEALVATKKVIIKPPSGIISVALRFRFNGTAGDQHVLQLFAAAGIDHYDLVDSLTIDQGSQIYVAGAAGTGIDFCDTVVSAGEKWASATVELSTTADNIGRYVMNMHGYDRLWIVASTLDIANSGTTLYIDWKAL